eukprot:3914076-Rhodomonas_salina.5
MPSTNGEVCTQPSLPRVPASEVDSCLQLQRFAVRVAAVARLWTDTTMLKLKGRVMHSLHSLPLLLPSCFPALSPTRPGSTLPCPHPAC